MIEHQTQTIPVQYFNEEVVRFREIMCSTEYTLEEKDNAFRGLTYVYLNIDPKDERCEQAEITFMTTSDEFQRRKVYEMLYRSQDAE